MPSYSYIRHQINKFVEDGKIEISYLNHVFNNLNSIFPKALPDMAELELFVEEYNIDDGLPVDDDIFDNIKKDVNGTPIDYAVENAYLFVFQDRMKDALLYYSTSNNLTNKLIDDFLEQYPQSPDIIDDIKNDFVLSLEDSKYSELMDNLSFDYDFNGYYTSFTLNQSTIKTQQELINVFYEYIRPYAFEKIAEDFEINLNKVNCYEKPNLL